MKIKKNISQKNKRVLVGVSGGVDSSVSILVLKKLGYEVEGVFAKVWQPDFVECTWREEKRDAMRVCAQLDIPFHFLDLEHEYKKFVADYMISEYQSGRTPNPDVMCNTHIKFGFMYDFAMQNNFEYIATGHYAQNIDSKLHRGRDNSKDQSYFLWNVSPEKFKRILFPIGNLEKKEVRALAQKHNLFTAEKKDSQGLCFIGPVDMKDFLKQLIQTTSGSVLNTKGEVIGEHEGVHLYTVGERHGFTIFPQHKDTHEKILYVIDKNIQHNTITVGEKPQIIKKIILKNTNFFQDIPVTSIDVQFRYRQKPLSAHITQENNEYVLYLKDTTEFVAIGQSAVFYNKNMCIGGGIVHEVIY